MASSAFVGEGCLAWLGRGSGDAGLGRCGRRGRGVWSLVVDMAGNCYHDIFHRAQLKGLGEPRL